MYFVKKQLLVLLFASLSLIIYIYISSNEKKFNTDDLLIKQHIPWGIEEMGLIDISQNSSFGKNVNIAVLDSGVEFTHPDFENKIHSGFNVLNPQQKPLDDNGHGTLITGVIAAKNNSFGVVGVAPNTNIYPVKVLDEFGEGEISNVVKGIEWCIENNIHIINMSFSLSYDDPQLRNAIQYALDEGIIIVASASNGRDNEVGFPASYQGVISVVAVDKKLTIYSESSQGKIDFSAPGVNVVSTALNGTYEIMEGNSIATPYITGLIAVLMKSDNNIKLTDILNTLERYSYDLGDNGIDTRYGYGFVKFRE